MQASLGWLMSSTLFDRLHISIGICISSFLETGFLWGKVLDTGSLQGEGRKRQMMKRSMVLRNNFVLIIVLSKAHLV